ncbi:arylformamidase [Comamonas sp. NoAH]|uniref:arylformamidase n=1 Tax=Comamonas halotolerans TaxID=3041496 RepID=UPI0024E05013|nr:arylformamidase [Comamonas sp. NoAH]
MTTHRQIWDISAPIHSASPVFPGDSPYQQSWSSSISPQCPVNVSTISMSPHIGSHADAPLHYDAQGQSMGEVNLEPYIGRCRVIHAMHCGPLIEWEHIAHATHTPLPARVLVRTYQQVPEYWDEHLSAFAPSTVERLADLGVRLIGIDTASIDPADSRSLDSHMLVRTRNLNVLENLVLDGVAEGDYELIALPLKLMQAEASPVRAILRSL